MPHDLIVLRDANFTSAIDTFTRPEQIDPNTGNGLALYNFSETGIIWPGEAKKYGASSYNASQIVPPPFWAKLYPNGYQDGQLPSLHTNEHFQVCGCRCCPSQRAGSLMTA